MALILLLDDDEAVREVSAELLSESGHSVVQACDGAEALGLLRSQGIDVLVTDIRMPGALNGWEVAEAARRIRPTLPVVYVSGFSSAPIRRVAGAAYIHKPFTMKGLADAVESAQRQAQWLEGFRLQGGLASSRLRPRTHRRGSSRTCDPAVDSSGSVIRSVEKPKHA